VGTVLGVTLAERLDRLDAYGEIRQLAARYGRDLDTRNMDALLGHYVPEIRRRLREAMEEPLRRVRITILHVGTHVIDFQDEDNAVGSVYCHAEIQNAEKNWISQAIHYGDRYVRRDGRWYFARARRHELFYGADHGVRPNGLPAADWPGSDTGTGSVPMRWESWQQFWGSGAQTPALPR
jgi:uncharacterized protein YchJ